MSASTREYEELERLIRAEEWRLAGHETGRLLAATGHTGLAHVREVDALWTSLTDGRHGLSVQRRILTQVPPLGSDREWAELLGWHGGGGFKCWSDDEHWAEISVTVAPAGSDPSHRETCFPFHDSLVGPVDWRSQFSTRDCWGGDWARWFELWAAV